MPTDKPITRVWLDDEYEQRKSWFPAEHGWVHCRWPEDIIKHLLTGTVEMVSLDHDLGEGSGYANPRTGYDVISWMEEAVFKGEWPFPNIPRFFIHSQNPEGRRRIAAGIRSIMQKHAENRQKLAQSS